MYQIALCDDEIVELNAVEGILSSYGGRNEEYEFMVRRFESAEKLLDLMEREEYTFDLLLMDIYMPGATGIETAKKLRQMGNSSRIIFLTTSREHALEAYSVNAVQYLVKPISPDALYPVLDGVFDALREEAFQYVLFQTDNHVRKVAVSDIICCEAQRKKQCVYLTDGESITLHLTMKKLCELTTGYKEFAKVGASYIVNLEHIERLSTQALWMDNKKEIYLPRGSYKVLREQYFNYYCGRAEQT